jgi:Ca2+-binding RTX toxin-like protein
MRRALRRSHHEVIAVPVRRRVPALATMLLVTTGLMVAGPPGTGSAASPTLHTFPGCAPTLQACVDAATPGDVVQVATDDLVAESVIIDKSLSLRAKSGFKPRLYGAYVFSDGSAGAVDVTVRRLTFTGNGISGRFVGGSGHRLALRQVVVESTSSYSQGVAVEMEVPATFVMTGSRSSTMGHQASAVFLSSRLAAGIASFRLVGNRLSLAGNAQSGSGIELRLDGAGRPRVDILNNTIFDVAGCYCGGSSGLFIYPNDTVRADVNIVGNTFHRSKSNALYVRNDLEATGRLALDVFNNIFSGATLRGIYLESRVASTLSFRGGYNAFSGNGRANILEGRSAGPGNVKGKPGYVNGSTGDLRLTASSPLIDAGVVCSLGGVANPDAAGRARLGGRSVDIGAYERGAAAAFGRAFVGAKGGDELRGTSRADIMCGYRGADLLDGRGGSDYIDGGDGADVLVGGPGSDRLFGGPGGDTLCASDGVAGNDRLDGGAGIDSYAADRGDTLVRVETRRACR